LVTLQKIKLAVQRHTRTWTARFVAFINCLNSCTFRSESSRVGACLSDTRETRRSCR
jgi:hypothetical protein